MLISKERTNHKDATITKDILIAETGKCLAQGLYVEASSILSKIIDEYKENLDASVYFNLALCYMQAKKPEKSINLLDQALDILKSSKMTSTIKFLTTPPDLELLELDAKTDAYLSAMTPLMATMFPDRSKIRMQRLLLDACIGANQFERAKKLISILKPHKFENVECALKILKN